MRLTRSTVNELEKIRPNFSTCASRDVVCVSGGGGRGRGRGRGGAEARLKTWKK